MKKIIGSFLLLTLLVPMLSSAQTDEQWKTQIKQCDSLLFNEGFNQCNLQYFNQLLTDDFIFYHDQAGITKGKENFIANVQRNICSIAYKPERKLVDSTLQIFLLRNNGNLYAAVENGQHLFYAIEPDGYKYLTSTASFSNLWLLQNNQWKLAQSLSYNHQPFARPVNAAKIFSDTTETMKLLRQLHIPALSIGYIKDNRIQHIRTFGSFNSTPNTPATIWNVASLTKPITTLLTLQFVNSGKWDLDSPLSNYWTDPDIQNDPRSKQLTTRLVLSHQTGFPNWRNGKLQFQFNPGTRYQYSGEGFEYLRHALEQKFNKNLQQLAATYLFKKPGLTHTKYTWNKDTDSLHFAIGYNPEGIAYPLEKNTTPNAADNLLTTITDYTQFLLWVMQDASLSPSLYNEMMKPQVATSKGKHFTLGFERYDLADNIFCLSHGGSDKGVQTLFFIFPQTKEALVIFTNADNGYLIYEEIIRHYLGSNGLQLIAIEKGK